MPWDDVQKRSGLGFLTSRSVGSICSECLVEPGNQRCEDLKGSRDGYQESEGSWAGVSLAGFVSTCSRSPSFPF